MVIIGYSGHAFVVCSILTASGIAPTGYCDNEVKTNNPFDLPYIGTELSAAGLTALKESGFFIAVGDNDIRNKIFLQLAEKNLLPVNAIHPSSIIDATVKMATHGVMIAAGVIINPLAHIGKGVICNTGSVIEHECQISDFAHIGPGAVLCGHVKIGEQTFVGANAVVRQGITIGKNVIIGAGAVVVNNIPDNVTVMGVPAK